MQGSAEDDCQWVDKGVVPSNTTGPVVNSKSVLNTEGSYVCTQVWMFGGGGGRRWRVRQSTHKLSRNTEFIFIVKLTSSITQQFTSHLFTSFGCISLTSLLCFISPFLGYTNCFVLSLELLWERLHSLNGPPYKRHIDLAQTHTRGTPIYYVKLLISEIFSDNVNVCEETKGLN